jgi:uncharacterized protein (DUF1684 family)
MKKLFILPALFVSLSAFSQSVYEDSLNAFRKNYINTHEVVQGHGREHLAFYPLNKELAVTASFKAINNSPWIPMKTSGAITKAHRVYGVLTFKVHDSMVHLNVYQSQTLLEDPKYKNYLFLPFTDATTGDETYEGGRYLDLTTEDIKGKKVLLDFNKAYNPYCAYVSGKYNCPIPPRENNLSIAITAGEKKYTSAH